MSGSPLPLPAGLFPGAPLTALAPMQDVTDLAFMRVTAHYGAPDYYFTEFLRVHAQSRPEAHIVRSITENDTGRPVFAQLIGEDLVHLRRTVAAHRQDYDHDDHDDRANRQQPGDDCPQTTWRRGHADSATAPAGRCLGHSLTTIR